VARAYSVTVGTPRGVGQLYTPTLTDTIGILDSRQQSTGGGATEPVQPGTVGFLGDEGDLDVLSGVQSLSGSPTYDGYYFDGGIYYDQAGGTLTLRNCVVDGSASWHVLYTIGVGATIDAEDTTFRFTNGNQNNTCIGIGAATDMSIVRCEITGSSDGIQCAGETLFDSNWVHDLNAFGTFPDNTHNDGLQMFDGNLNMLRNYFDCPATSPWANSCAFFQEGGGNVITSDEIAYNHFKGGGYALYLEDGTHDHVHHNIWEAPHLHGTHAIGGGAGATGTVVSWHDNVTHLGAPVNE
jgi:hypothetical protein